MVRPSVGRLKRRASGGAGGSDLLDDYVFDGVDFQYSNSGDVFADYGGSICGRKGESAVVDDSGNAIMFLRVYVAGCHTAQCDCVWNRSGPYGGVGAGGVGLKSGRRGCDYGRDLCVWKCRVRDRCVCDAGLGTVGIEVRQSGTGIVYRKAVGYI